MKKLTQLAAVFVILSSAVNAQEKWSYKDGKSANLELLRTLKKEGDLVGEFKDKDGTMVTIKESALVDTDAARLREFKKAVNPDFLVIESMITKLRDGKELTEDDIKRCAEEWKVFGAKMVDKNRTELNTEFAKGDQGDYYIGAIKMALVDFKNHGGWPFRSTIRLLVSDELEKRANQTNDPFVHFCAIFPFLCKNEVRKAAASYKSIQKSDPFLASTAANWTKKYLHDSETKTEFIKATGME